MSLKLNKKVPAQYGGGLFTGIAQLVEHRSPKPRVVGSSPPSRAKKESSMKIIKTFINYCKACYDELAHKVTWPTRKELTQSAVVVLSASLIIAVVVWVMDVVFKAVMSSVYPN